MQKLNAHKNPQEHALLASKIASGTIQYRPNMETLPPPPQPVRDWRQERKSQKQAVVEGNRKPLNGHRFPGRARKPPQDPVADLSVTRNTWLTRIRKAEIPRIDLH